LRQISKDIKLNSPHTLSKLETVAEQYLKSDEDSSRAIHAPADIKVILEESKEDYSVIINNSKVQLD